MNRWLYSTNAKDIGTLYIISYKLTWAMVVKGMGGAWERIMRIWEKRKNVLNMESKKKGKEERKGEMDKDNEKKGNVERKEEGETKEKEKLKEEMGKGKQIMIGTLVVIGIIIFSWIKVKVGWSTKSILIVIMIGVVLFCIRKILRTYLVVGIYFKLLDKIAEKYFNEEEKRETEELKESIRKKIEIRRLKGGIVVGLREKCTREIREEIKEEYEKKKEKGWKEVIRYYYKRIRLSEVVLHINMLMGYPKDYIGVIPYGWREWRMKYGEIRRSIGGVMVIVLIRILRRMYKGVEEKLYWWEKVWVDSLYEVILIIGIIQLMIIVMDMIVGIIYTWKMSKEYKQDGKGERGIYSKEGRLAVMGIVIKGIMGIMGIIIIIGILKGLEGWEGYWLYWEITGIKLDGVKEMVVGGIGGKVGKEGYKVGREVGKVLARGVQNVNVERKEAGETTELVELMGKSIQEGMNDEIKRVIEESKNSEGGEGYNKNNFWKRLGEGMIMAVSGGVAATWASKSYEGWEEEKVKKEREEKEEIRREYEEKIAIWEKERKELRELKEIVRKKGWKGKERE